MATWSNVVPGFKYICTAAAVAVPLSVAYAKTDMAYNGINYLVSGAASGLASGVGHLLTGTGRLLTAVGGLAVEHIPKIPEYAANLYEMGATSEMASSLNLQSAGVAFAGLATIGVLGAGLYYGIPAIKQYNLKNAANAQTKAARAILAKANADKAAADAAAGRALAQIAAGTVANVPPGTANQILTASNEANAAKNSITAPNDRLAEVQTQYGNALREAANAQDTTRTPAARQEALAAAKTAIGLAQTAANFISAAKNTAETQEIIAKEFVDAFVAAVPAPAPVLAAPAVPAAPLAQPPVNKPWHQRLLDDTCDLGKRVIEQLPSSGEKLLAVGAALVPLTLAPVRVIATGALAAGAHYLKTQMPTSWGAKLVDDTCQLVSRGTDLLTSPTTKLIVGGLSGVGLAFTPYLLPVGAVIGGVAALTHGLVTGWKGTPRVNVDFSTLPQYQANIHRIKLQEALFHTACDYSTEPSDVSLREDNSIVVSCLKVINNEPFLRKSLPYAIQSRIKEHELFGQDIANIAHQENPMISEGTQNALLAIGGLLRQSELKAPDLKTLRDQLKILIESNEVLAIDDQYNKRIRELFVLLEYSQNEHCVDGVAAVYKALTHLSPYKPQHLDNGTDPFIFPPRMKDADANAIVQTLASLIGNTDVENPKVAFCVAGDVPSFEDYTPQLIIYTVPEDRVATDLKPTQLKTEDGNKLFRLTGMVHTNDTGTGAASVRRKGQYFGAQWYECNNCRYNQNTKVNAREKLQFRTASLLVARLDD